MHHTTRNAPRLFSLGFLAIAAFMCGAAHAESVFKCRGSDGLVAYQDHSCARNAVETQVELEPEVEHELRPRFGEQQEKRK